MLKLKTHVQPANSGDLMKLLRGCTFLFLVASASAQQPYDLLLRGGHVIDAKNKVSAIRDVAIQGGKIAAVAPTIDPALSLKTVDVCWAVRDPGAGGYPRSRLCRNRRAEVLCR